MSEKSLRETLRTRVRIESKEPNEYQFFCWLPCQNQEVLRDVEPIIRPEVIRITSEQPSGGVVLEEWLIRNQEAQRRYQVRYFYVPGD